MVGVVLLHVGGLLLLLPVCHQSIHQLQLLCQVARHRHTLKVEPAPCYLMMDKAAQTKHTTQGTA